MLTLRKTLCSLLCLIPLAHLSAQEICDNGLDDDGDGLVDLNDTTDCACHAASGAFSDDYLPNPTFAQHTCLPTHFEQMNCCQDWEQATNGTSDYLYLGSYDPPGLAPLPLLGSDSAFVGAYATYDYKEYVGACLTQPLLAGQTYTFQVYAATNAPRGIFGIYAPVAFAPFQLTLWGYPTCYPFPVPNTDPWGCPEPFGWTSIGTVSYTPSFAWTTATMTFTPSFDVGSVMLGAPCDMPISYPNVDNYFNGLPYVMYDDPRIELIAPPGPTTSVSSSGSWCRNDLVLHGHPDTLATAFQWYLNGEALVGRTDSSLALSALGLAPGTYQFRAVADTNCSVASITLAPPQYPYALIAAAPNSGCVPLAVDLTSPTPSSLIGTAQWDFGDGSPLDTTLTPHHSYNAAGAYDVSLHLVSPEGCVGDTTYVHLIEVHDLPHPWFTADTTAGCAPLAVTFAEDADTLYTLCSWDFGDGSSAVSCSPEHVYSSGGVYGVQLTVTDQHGCVNDTTRSAYIQVFPVPALSLSVDPTTGCAPLHVTFSNTTPAVDVASQLWHFGNGASSMVGVASTDYLQPGTYTATLHVESPLGCAADSAWNVVVHAVPYSTFNSIADSGCAPFSVDFFNAAPPSFTGSCTWHFGDGTTSTDCAPTHLFLQPGTFTASLHLESTDGCASDTTFPGPITVRPKPDAAFTFSPDRPVLPYTTIAFSDASSSDVDHWNWAFGAGGALGTSDLQDPSFTFPTGGAGGYPVHLYVTNPFGCTDTALAQVVIHQDLEVYIPNAFTADGDGINETWMVVGRDLDPDRFDLRVFDRWGEEIWHATDPAQQWDGSYAGQPAALGVYSWELVAHQLSGTRSIRRFGHVTLLR